MKISKKNFWVIAIIFAFIALGVRLAWLYQDNPITLGGDEPEYVSLGKTMAESNSFRNGEVLQTICQGGKPYEPTAYRSPVLPFFLAIHYKIFGFSNIYPRITLVFLSAIVCLFLAGIGKTMENETAGLLASAIWIFYPPSLFGAYSADRLYTEGIAVFFLAGAVAFFFKSIKDFSVKWCIWGGAFLGLAILTRGYLLFIIPAYLLLIGFSKVKQKWKIILIVFGIACLIPTAWVIRNKIMLGKFVLSNQTESFYLGNNKFARGSFNGDIFTLGWDAPQYRIIKEKYPNVEEMSEVERSEMWQREGINAVLENPGHFFWLLPRKAAIYLLPLQFWEYGFYKYHYLYGFLSLYAIVAFFIRKDSFKDLVFLLTPFAAVLISCLITYGFDRYRFVVEPCIIIAGAVGLIETLQRFKKLFFKSAYIETET